MCTLKREYMLTPGILSVNRVKIGEECGTIQIIQHDKGEKKND